MSGEISEREMIDARMRFTRSKGNKEGPVYVHDCSACVFLGRHNDHDLYHCKKEFETTIIARYGSDGPQYKSGMIFGRDALMPALREAYLRAKIEGLDVESLV